MVIKGERFTGTMSVSFGGTPAASFTVDSDTQITAVTPAHAAGTAYVTVANGAGSSPAQSSLAAYSYGEGGWKATASIPDRPRRRAHCDAAGQRQGADRRRHRALRERTLPRPRLGAAI